MKEIKCYVSCHLFPKGFEINLFSDDSIIMKSVYWKQHYDRFSNTCVEIRKVTHFKAGLNRQRPKLEIKKITLRPNIKSEIPIKRDMWVINRDVWPCVQSQGTGCQGRDACEIRCPLHIPYIYSSRYRIKKIKEAAMCSEIHMKGRGIKFPHFS